MSYKITDAIIGGVGPKATASFMDRLYQDDVNREQDYPRILIISDPLMPDRSQAILDNDHSGVESYLNNLLSRLVEFGVERLTVLCITLHFFIPRVIHSYPQIEFLSLVDLALEKVCVKQKYLILCTAGTRSGRVFEGSKFWDIKSEALIFLDDSDQMVIHELIYQIKVNGTSMKVFRKIEMLINEYGADGWIAGCTEFHLVLNCLGKEVRLGSTVGNCIDPVNLAVNAIKEKQCNR